MCMHNTHAHIHCVKILSQSAFRHLLIATPIADMQNHPNAGKCSDIISVLYATPSHTLTQTRTQPNKCTYERNNKQGHSATSC